MSKPRKLSRPEIEGLAAFFGCRVMTTPSNKDNRYNEWDVYVVHGETKEKVGTVTINNPIYIPWTNHQWTEAFQRISGISGANLWTQGKRGRG